MDDIPLRPENFRILHPEIIYKTGQALKEYALKQGNVSSIIFFLYSCETPLYSANALLYVLTMLYANKKKSL